ncbi:MAG: hypothetical protein EBW14_06630 [Oxalobacteraceae bacterium]|nr:hypothetical protein [Oxalobacteraceae bacterium]
MRFTLLIRLALLVALSLTSSHAHASKLLFNCRGYMPIYLGSWVPINPDPTEFDPLAIEIDESTKMTSFVLTMIGRVNFATKVSEAHVKGAIAYKKLMIDDMIEFIDFHLNRGTGEVNITALQKSPRKGRMLYRGKCNLYKPPF